MGPAQYICQPNLVSAKTDPRVIDENLALNLKKGRVAEMLKLCPPFIVSPLGLVPKPSGGFCHIHHFSSLVKCSVNDHIPSHYNSLRYSLFGDALNQVRTAGPGAIHVKRDLADAFRHIPIHLVDWWLFGCEWRGKFFQQQCLPFVLRTAPRIFNFFAEALHCILDSRSSAAITHYLYDFLPVFAAADAVAAQE